MRPESEQTNDYRAYYLFIYHFTLIYSCLSIYQIKTVFLDGLVVFVKLFMIM